MCTEQHDSNPQDNHVHKCSLTTHDPHTTVHQCADPCGYQWISVTNFV